MMEPGQDAPTAALTFARALALLEATAALSAGPSSLENFW